MKILITGGAGYKGLKLAQALLERGHEVTVLDNFMYGTEAALFLFSHHPRVRFLAKDIRAVEQEDVESAEVIFHLAAISGYPACEASPHSAQMINVVGTDTLVSLLRPEQRLVYASTTSIYGQSGEICTESSEINPRSLYAITKYEAEKRCLQFSNAIALRFATIFGVAPRMRWDLMPNDFVMRALHERSLVLFDALSVRTFLHIDDAIQAYLLCLEQGEQLAGQVFNVGAEHMNLSKRDLAQAIQKHVDFSIVDSDLADPDVRNFYINFDRISALGFKPTKSLDEGVEELVALFKIFRPTRPFRII